jgi:hypothetical protein
VKRIVVMIAGILLSSCNASVDQPVQIPIVSSQSSASVDVLVLDGTSSSRPVDAPTKYTNITAYFGNQAVINASDCRATIGVSRRIAQSANMADAVLKKLFTGTTVDEQANGIVDAFTGKSMPLITAYRGVNILDRIATVDFNQTGLEYLNAEACWQLQVKQSIERTLMQFSNVQQVQYTINGVLFTEWDA